MPRLRTLFDTNIYGLFIERNEFSLIEKIAESDKFIVYGNKIIRDELRATPKRKRFGEKSYRSILLKNFDLITGNHLIELTKGMESLARAYFKEFKKSNGIKSWGKLKDDFLIVACASSKNLDLVVSEDDKTMRSSKAMNAYRIVNAKNNLRTPTFFGYSDLKKIL